MRDTPPGSQSVLDSLSRHASCRHYTDESVSTEDVDLLVRCAQRAATSSNLQMWSAVVVRDEDRKERLAHLCGDQDHIRRAPVFVAWCADRHRLDQASQVRGYRQDASTVEAFLVAAVDTAIAMQNAVVAAEAMGYGTCYIGGIRNDTAAVCRLLDLPQHVFPVAGMTLGRPAREPVMRPRLPPTTVVHRETYQPASGADLQQYDTEMRLTGIYHGRQASGIDAQGLPSEALPDTEYGWLEHSARRVSQATRRDLRRVLSAQGFELQ